MAIVFCCSGMFRKSFLVVFIFIFFANSFCSSRLNDDILYDSSHSIFKNILSTQLIKNVSEKAGGGTSESKLIAISLSLITERDPGKVLTCMFTNFIVLAMKDKDTNVDDEITDLMKQRLMYFWKEFREIKSKIDSGFILEQGLRRNCLNALQNVNNNRKALDSKDISWLFRETMNAFKEDGNIKFFTFFDELHGILANYHDVIGISLKSKMEFERR